MAGDTTIQENAEAAALKRAKETRNEEEHVVNTYHKKVLRRAGKAFTGKAFNGLDIRNNEIKEPLEKQLEQHYATLYGKLTKIAKEKYALLPREERLRLRVLRTGEPWWIGRTLWRKITPSVQGKLAKWFFPKLQDKLEVREAWIRNCRLQLLEDYIKAEKKQKEKLDERIRKLNAEHQSADTTHDEDGQKKAKRNEKALEGVLQKVNSVQAYQEQWIKYLKERLGTPGVQFNEEQEEQYKSLALTKTQKQLIREQVDPVLGEKEYRAAKERERQRVQKVREEDKEMTEKFRLDYEEDKHLSEILEEIRTPAEIQALLQEEKKTRTLEEHIFKKYYKEEKNNVEAAFKGLSLAQTKQYSRRMDWEEGEIFIQSLVQPRLEQRFKALDAELTQIAKEKYATLPESEQIHLKFLRTRKLAWAFGWLKYIWPSPEWKIVQRLYPSLKGKLKKRERWIKDCKQHLLKDYIEKERGKWEAQKWETKKATLKAEKEKLEAIQNTWRSKRPWRWTRYSYSWIVKKRIQKLDALLEKIEKLRQYNDKWIIYISEKRTAEANKLLANGEPLLDENRNLQMTETQKKLIRKEATRRIDEVKYRVDSVRKQQKQQGTYIEREDEVTAQGAVVQNTDESRNVADFDEVLEVSKQNQEQTTALTKILHKTAKKRYEQRFGKVSWFKRIRALNPWAKQLKNVLRVRAMRKEQTVAALVPVLAEQERDRSEARETQLDSLSATVVEAKKLLMSADGPVAEDGETNTNISSETTRSKGVGTVEKEIKYLKENENTYKENIVKESEKQIRETNTLGHSDRAASNSSIGTTVSKLGEANGSKFKAISRIGSTFGFSKSRKKRKADSQPANSFGVSTGS